MIGHQELHKSSLLICACIALGLTAAASANAGLQSARLPPAGITMKAVRTEFGQPERELPAVGRPPITRWIYPDYVVYFEYNRVIHTVLKSDPGR